MLAKHDEHPTRAAIARLTAEIAYLQQAVTGTVQLYLYDPAASRIIEVIGTPSPKTTHVITYVPGTVTNLNDFYANAVQQISHFLADPRGDAVAFVYKDGPFPGGDDNVSESNLIRVLEANDQKGAIAAGKTLAAFQTGIAQDPHLSQAETVAIGHSWGLTNMTASEMSGANYDRVLSLSGAWMPKGWEAQDVTRYSDFSYDDILQGAQGAGVVGDGNYPRAESAFEHGQYYRAPGDLFMYFPDDNEQHQVNPSHEQLDKAHLLSCVAGGYTWPDQGSVRLKGEPDIHRLLADIAELYEKESGFTVQWGHTLDGAEKLTITARSGASYIVAPWHNDSELHISTFSDCFELGPDEWSGGAF